MLDIDLLGLGQHGDRGRRGVDPSLRLGDRHPLHPVRPAFVLHPRPHAVARQQERDLVVARPLPTGPSRAPRASNPCRSAKPWYIWNRSRAKRLASSPPSAPRISTMTLRSSFGSFGSSSSLQLVVETLDVRRRRVDLGSCELAVVARRVGDICLAASRSSRPRPELRAPATRLLRAPCGAWPARCSEPGRRTRPDRQGAPRRRQNSDSSPVRRCNTARRLQTPVAGDGPDLGGGPQPLGERSRDRMVVPVRDHEHEIGLRTKRETGFGRYGDEVEVDAHGAHHHRAVGGRRPRCSRSRIPLRGLGRGAASRRSTPTRRGSLRIVHAQPSLGNELVQRMSRRTGPTLVLHDVDHASERRIRRKRRRAPLPSAGDRLRRRRPRARSAETRATSSPRTSPAR